MAIVLVLGVMLSSWLLLRDRARNAPPRFNGPPRSDYQLHDFELASYDDSGRLSFQLNSPRLTHDDARSAFHIDDPKFRFFNREGNAWNAASKYALINTQTKMVAMRDNVRVTQASSESKGEFVLTTQALDADTNNKLLSSETTVTVQRPGSILRGIGMKADLDTKSFELAAAVRGRFEVRHD